jgi:glycosyltransferase involved in cell wall biosynthesis
VLCIARLLRQKGVIEFIEVAKKFKNQLNKKTIKFLLIGEIENHHSDRIDKNYILQAEARGIINRVLWTDDIKSYLHQSDILFLHSYREGGPRVIVEAAASAIPTIGSDAIGVRDLIINNKTGFITEPKNIEMAFIAVNELINNKNKREEFGNNALNLIAKPISLEKATEVQIQHYLKANLFS